MSNSENQLLGHIREYRRKYYMNQIIRGGIVLALITTSILFLSIMGEGLLGFSSGVRTGMIVALGIIFAGVLGYSVAWPASKLFNLSKPISDRDIAELVRRHFPDIDDKLVNLLELKGESSDRENSLAIAAIEKKTAELAPIKFSRAINLNVNWKYARYLAVPAALFLLLWLINPDVLRNGTKRLVNFNEEFLPPPPFQIDIANHTDELIAGDDFTLEANVDGDELPADLYLYIKKASEDDYINYPMDKLRGDQFAYEFNNIKEDFNYYVGNEEVISEVYGIDVLERPAIRDFRVVIDYPGYTGMPNDTLASNVGDFKLLRGSQATWLLQTEGSIKEARYYGNDTVDFTAMPGNGNYQRQKQVLNAERYFISLKSKRDIGNIDTVRYQIEVVQDRHPSVYVNNAQEFIADYTMFMPLDFEISDDYGFTNLELYYRFTKSPSDNKVGPKYQNISLKVDPKALLQKKALEVDLMTLGMEEGDIIEYYVKVWDNDFVAGPKASTSSIFRVNYPSINEKFEEVEEAQEDIEEELNELIEDVEDIKNTLDKFQEKMLEQKKLSYDDKKELQQMAEKHESVMERVEEMSDQFEENMEKLQNNEMITERTLEKYEQLNELMDKLNNDKLNDYMEKLREQMDEMNPQQMKDMMEEAEFNEEDLEKALERTMELLKQLEVDQKTEELMQKLENMEQQQEMINEKMNETKKNDKEGMENLKEKQDQLAEDMKDMADELDKLEDMKKETQTPNKEEMDQLQQEADDVQQEMENSSDQMDQKDQKGANESQQNSQEKMEQMQEQLQQMMQQGQQEQDQENLDDLRDLLENLLKLSFRQEDLRDEVEGLRSNDPLLFKKEIEQKQLLDDMYMVKDSLDALAKRVFQIEKFVTDESNKIVRSMESAQKWMDNKQIPRSASSQHQSMTSINNLANMLTDVMQQMQQQMQNQKGGMSMCKKPNGNRPNMQQIGKQQGELNQMMQQMMDGKNLDPKKLGQMAKMQEMLRQQLKEAHEGLKMDGENGLGNMGQIMKDMQDTEDELKNKMLTEATMKRQRRILQRLLDSMKSVREKEQFENKRKSKTGNQDDRQSPDKLEIEEYKNRLRQEMLKSNQLEYSSDFIILIEKYFKLLEDSNE